MRKMKDSGIEWIGEIPEEWEVGRVKNYYKSISGSGFRDAIQGETDGDYPVCKAADIGRAGHFMVSANNYISKQMAISEGFKIIPKGSVLFPKIGEAMRKNSRSLATRDCCLDNNCQGMVPQGIDEFYGYYLFLCIDMRWFDNAGTVPCINNVSLLNFHISIPQIVIQKNICKFLDEKCSEIDSLIADIEKQIETLEQYKKSVITEAVTKGLDPNVEMKDSGIEWIGEIPAHWEMSSIKRKCFLKTGSTPPTKNQEWFDGDLLWFTPGDLVDNYYVNKSERTLSNKAKKAGVATIIPNDSVLFVGIGATAGKVGFSKNECSCNQQITGIISDSLCPSYLLYWMIGNQEQIKATATYTTIPIINNQTIGNYLLLSPARHEEQIRIAEYLDNKCDEIEEIIKIDNSRIDNLRQYKKSLIYEYVTGKKEVNAK